MLEVLVAVLIAGLALGLLFRTAVSGITAVRIAEGYGTALALARSHLALVGAGTLSEGVTEGDDGAFHWATRVIPASASAPPAGLVERVRHAGELVPVLYRVTVAVEWRSGGTTRRLGLETSRLGFEPPRAGGP